MRGVPLVAHVTPRTSTTSPTSAPWSRTCPPFDAAGGRADGLMSCRGIVATIRNHIVIASPPASLLRSSAVAARPTVAALACSAGSSSARSLGSTGFVASPFAMNAKAVHHAFLTLGCALIWWNYLKSTGRVF